jgi:hypothetical protein
MTSAFTEFTAGTHYLHFSNSFLLANTGFNLNQVSFLQIKLNGNTIYYSYQSGIDNLVVPITVTNQSRKMDMTIIIEANGTQKYYPIDPDQIGNTPVTGCSGADVEDVVGFPIDGGYGEGSYSAKGRASIYYANQNCSTHHITKPIIFVDGFDPFNKQHADTIWAKYLNEKFVEGGIDKRLGNELRAAGYDLIIFDQMDTGPNRGGAGLIENNALALAKYIETLYMYHGSTIQEDLVIVGASMGGLITRYALAWMEQNNKPHHTRLFVSFDSPQNGAQIPIGLQLLVDDFTQYGAASNFPIASNAMHQSSAAKQMLLHHVYPNSETIAAHPYRQQFINNLAAVGNWPNQCRMIAIVDGNRNGIKKTVDPDGPLGGNGENIPAINGCDQELRFGFKRRFTPFCDADYCYKMKIDVFAQTENARCKSHEITMNSANIPLFLLAGFFPFLTFTNYTQSQNNTSFDLAPGSRMRKNPLAAVTPAINVILSGLVGGLLSIPLNTVKYTNFVPTISAAAYTFPNNEPFNIYKNFNGVNLSRCAGTTPFDTVYAGSEDLDHVAINSTIAAAFRSEVFYPKPKSVCSGGCPDYLVSQATIGGSINFKAKKAITLIPPFNVDARTPVVFKAEIGGCANALSLPQPNGKNNTTPTTTSTCGSFTWDGSRNTCVRNGSTVTFQVFVTNMDISAYAEFSIDGSNYYKATLMDDGWQITVPYISGGNQFFWARASDKRSNTIFGSLGHCN